MKILVVEDDRAVAQSLQLLLGRYNHAVDIAADGEAALQMVDAFEYHLVILDVLLPRLGGVEVCRQLRKQGFRQPILLLTGQGETQQKAIALNIGADDYVVKPFDNDELVARIQALLRRGVTVGEPILTWNHLSLDPNTRRVAYRDQLLVLTPKEYAILELFLRHQETVFSARAILDQAWSSVESPGEEAVRCHIKDLRQKLVAVGAPKDLIKTVYRVGYRLNPLYASLTPTRVDQSSNVPQVAELRAVNEELRVANEELQIANEKLQVANEELQIANEKLQATQAELQQRNQELQAVRDELEQHVAVRTAELSQREAFLNSIYDGVAQFIFVVDVTETNDLRYVSFNRFAQQSTDLSLQDVQHKTPEEVFGLETGALFRQNYERCLQANRSITYEDHFTFHDRSFWMLTTLFPLRNPQGRIDRIVGTVLDISDRKQAELILQKQIQQEYLLNDIAQEIRRSLQLDDVLSSTVHRVRAFLGVDRVIIFRFRPDWQGDVIMESVGAEWLPILSTTISDPCFRAHYLEPYRQGRVAAISDIDTADLEPCHVELLHQFQVKANLVVPILQSAHLWGLLIAHHCTAPRQWQPAEMAALQRLATQVGIAIQQSELYQQLQIELNDRKRAEQKIRQQAALLDISTDAILVCDLENTILYWNQGAEHLYGWTVEEALGQQANKLLSVNTAEVAKIMQTVLAQSEWHGEIHKVTKTGRAVIVEGRWTLVRDEVGQPKSILIVDTDITEKKSLEAQFYQAQRLESLGTLTSGIAHDLNNALTPILTITHLLRLQQPGMDSQSQEMLQVLETSAQRGADMVRQILTFTRGMGGERTSVDVASLLQEVVKVAQQTLPKFITVQVIVPVPGVRQVSADATQLHQVLMNLCVNARDAMPNGGTLTLSVENFEANEIFAQLNLDAQVGQYVLITVADTGTGIALEARDRIFEPFFTTKAHGRGTGLGLSTVLGIVRSYGGFIQVASEVGKGTQFKVYLPAIETEAASHHQETPPPLGQGELILVIDDEDHILQATRAMLETHHYQVLTARNGTEAIAIYTQHQQDIALVLVDMMMPDMDGTTVIQSLQEMNPQVRVIAVSGLLPQYQQTLETLGIKTRLNKPYTTEELLNRIHLELLPEA